MRSLGGQFRPNDEFARAIAEVLYFLDYRSGGSEFSIPADVALGRISAIPPRSIQQPVGLEESKRKSDWAKPDFVDFEG